MLVLVSYDVSTVDAAGRKRLRRVAKKCQDYGIRVQNSVFECLVEPDRWVRLKSELLKIYNDKEDSLRFYFLGKNWQHKVEHFGTKKTPDLEKDVLIV